MKYLGQTNVILHTEIITSSNSFYLTQSHYIQMILDKFGYSNYSFISILYDPSIQLVKNNDNFVIQERLHKLLDYFYI